MGPRCVCVGARGVRRVWGGERGVAREVWRAYPWMALEEAVEDVVGSLAWLVARGGEAVRAGVGRGGGGAEVTGIPAEEERGEGRDLKAVGSGGVRS